MRRMQTWRWVLAAVLLAMGGTTGRAEEFAIQSFDGTGKLSFNRVATAMTYRVEWAPTPAGPWTNTWAGLASIAQFATGSYTCSVPMCYRVVASVTDYLVVDVSGGTGATSYPVSYLTSVPVGGWTDDYKTGKIVFCRIPATPGYTMGSPTNEVGRYGDEMQQHQVTLTADFYIGVFPITQRQWELVMGNKPSYFTNATYYASRPVEQVSYYEIRENPLPVIGQNTKGSAISPNWPATNAVHADSFMGKLRAKTGLTGFDLPTEAQWEYACRAGTTTALNSGYDLTNTVQDAHMDQVGRYLYNGPNTYGYDQGVATNGGTAAVGSYLPNAWGLYDMHGNVFQWCLDWWETYPGTVIDPKGATSGMTRVGRGGPWLGEARDCRSAFRSNYFFPYCGTYFFGFRAALAPPGQ
jgi:formylglycine-generating enzyme required for sulfatase activity